MSPAVPLLGAQRWRDGAHIFRPLGEEAPVRPYEVAQIARTPAVAFVERHHYARSCPPPRWSFGLHRAGQLVGVAVFSNSMQGRVLTNVFPGEEKESVELGRLVLLDEEPTNTESWFVARCFARLRREGLRGVVSFADPYPRVSPTTRQEVFPGHIGVIYQALNALYLGRGTPRKHHLFTDCQVAGPRTLQKVRRQERGWEGAVRYLVSLGARRLGAGESPSAWLKEVLPRVTWRLKHPGNFRYVWAFNRADRKRLETRARTLALPLARPLPYPRRVDVPTPQPLLWGEEDL